MDALTGTRGGGRPPHIRCRRRGASDRGFGPARGAGSRKITNKATYKNAVEIACKITTKIASKITTRITTKITTKITGKIEIGRFR